MGVLVLSAVQGDAECPVATFPLATAGPLQKFKNLNVIAFDRYSDHLSLVSLVAGAPLPPPSLEAASVVVSLPSVGLLAPTIGKSLHFNTCYYLPCCLIG